MPLLAGMPTPLRQALDAALLRADAPGGSVDQRAVSLAAAHALRSSRRRCAPDRRDRRSPVDRRALGPRAVVRPAARRRRADRRARVGQARIGLGGRSRGSRSGHDRGPTHLARRPAAARAARADPSRANEPPTAPPGRGPAPPHHRRQPAVRDRDGPGGFRRWPPGRSRRRLGGAGGPAAAPVREACRVATRGARAPARDRRDVPADLGAGARDRRIERADARIPRPGPRAPASSSGRVAGCGSRTPSWRPPST